MFKTYRARKSHRRGKSNALLRNVANKLCYRLGEIKRSQNRDLNLFHPEGGYLDFITDSQASVFPHPNQASATCSFSAYTAGGIFIYIFSIFACVLLCLLAAAPTYCCACLLLRLPYVHCSACLCLSFILAYALHLYIYAVCRIWHT